MSLADFPTELIAMAALMAASGFFSCSEAALFSLSRSLRAAMTGGTESERRAVALLEHPERLLTAILFWNLVINMIYFALASVVTLRLARAASAGEASGWAPQAMTGGSLAAIILTSELLPKSLGVLEPRRLGALVSAPLGVAVRVLDPLIPLLQSASDLFGRLLLPRLQTETHLELADLERAVELGSGDTLDSEAMLIQERQVLQRLVELADTSVVELMRPRRRCLVLCPPVGLADLTGRLEGVGEYLLITEPDSDEIATAAALDRLAFLPAEHLERHAEPVVFVPWCTSASVTLSLLRERNRRVAVVLNELGETIGIVTIERLLDAVLRDATRPDPGDAHAARLRQVDPTAWEASGATPLRRVAKRLERWSSEGGGDPTQLAGSLRLTETFDSARSRTVGGLVQELLERAPREGDRVWCAGLLWTVTAGPTDETAGDDAPVVVRIEPAPDEDGAPTAETAPPEEEA